MKIEAIQNVAHLLLVNLQVSRVFFSEPLLIYVSFAEGTILEVYVELHYKGIRVSDFDNKEIILTPMYIQMMLHSKDFFRN